MPKVGGEVRVSWLTSFLNLFRRSKVSKGPEREVFVDANADTEEDDGSVDSDTTAVERSWENLGRYNAKTWSWQDQ